MESNLHKHESYTGELIHMGWFACTADDPDWSRPNQVSEWPTISFTVLPVRIHQSDADPFVADSNTAIYFNVCRPYTRSKIHEHGARAFYVEVHPNALADSIREYDPAAADDARTPFRFTHGPAASKNYLVERLMLEHVSSAGLVDPLRVEETTLVALGNVVRDAYTVRGRRSRPLRLSTERLRQDCVERVKQLLATRYADKLTLHEIARSAETSPYHLSRIFRSQTGWTVHRYLNRLRLRAAIERLQDDSRTLGCIAAETGFSSHPHFADSFRREFGLPPSRVRELLHMGDFPSFSA